MVGVYLGLAVAAVALAMIPAVLLQRKSPSSTVAWILALLFLPGVGVTLFLLFGRDRLRLPVRRKPAADRRLGVRRSRVPAPRGDESSLDRSLFDVGAALSGRAPSRGNRVDLLVDGAETYAAIGEALDQAKRSVCAAYYLIQRGKTADWFREKLIAAAQRGVEVRLLVDGFGSFWLPSSWFRPLRKTGARCVVFLPARLIFLQPMNLRNHRKILVVDDELAFTGGINIDDAYVGETEPWRDTHMRIQGPAARLLSDVFAEDWHFATGEALPLLGDTAGGGDENSSSALPDSSDAVVAVVRSGPDIAGIQRETIHRMLFAAIGLAGREVSITTPYFIPDRAILVALQTAALRGVTVRLLLPSRSNHPLVWWAGRSFYESLIQSGVEIYEYAPGMVHAKTMVVDDTIGLVGSANMDLRSFRLNFEVFSVVRDTRFAEQLRACFGNDLENSRRVELEDVVGSTMTRLRMGAARLLIPLM